MSLSASTTAGPGSAVNTSRTGSSLPPIDSGAMSSRARWLDNDGLTSNMCAPSESSSPGHHVVRVVLHQRRPAGQPGAHDGGDPHEHRRLPVALGTEPVPVGHQALHGEPGQLTQRAEVLERGGERAEAAVLEELAEPDLDRRAVPQRIVSVGAGHEARHDVVEVEVLLDQRRRSARRWRTRRATPGPSPPTC